MIRSIRIDHEKKKFDHHHFSIELIMEKYRVPNRQNLLRAREYGLENAFIHLEQTRRLPNFVLCKYRNLTSYHHSSIATMSLEQADHR